MNKDIIRFFDPNVAIVTFKPDNDDVPLGFEVLAGAVFASNVLTGQFLTNAMTGSVGIIGYGDGIFSIGDDIVDDCISNDNRVLPFL